MYRPVLSERGIHMEREGVTTKQLNELPVEGLIIRNDGEFWRCDKVILDANSQGVEVHMTPVDSVVPKMISN